MKESGQRIEKGGGLMPRVVLSGDPLKKSGDELFRPDTVIYPKWLNREAMSICLYMFNLGCTMLNRIEKEKICLYGTLKCGRLLFTSLWNNPFLFLFHSINPFYKFVMHYDVLVRQKAAAWKVVLEFKNLN